MAEINSLQLSGFVVTAPRMTGIPGMDTCRFWLVDPSLQGKYQFRIEVLGQRRLGEEMYEQLQVGDWVTIGGFLRLERTIKVDGHRFCSFLAVARVFNTGSRRAGQES